MTMHDPAGTDVRHRAVLSPAPAKPAASRTPNERSLRRTIVWGSFVVFGLAGGLFAWAATAEIAGAVIASGTIVVDTNPRTVQHLEGGIVDTLAVRDGSRVTSGDVLLTLRDATTQARVNATTAQITELAVERARLQAERDGAEAVTFPTLLADQADDPTVQRIFASQESLFKSRREAIAGTRAQLDERVVQLKDQIIGLEAQLEAKREQFELMSDNRSDLETLREKGLVQRDRITTLESQIIDLKGAQGQLQAEIARVKGAINETRLQSIQVEEERRSEALGQLREVRTRLATLQQERITALERLGRLQVLAPQSGLVHNLQVHTIGGVVQAGAPLMQIVPDTEALVLSAHVRPQDIDKVSLDQTARIRFPSFDMRTTPELLGTVLRIGADVSVDEATRLSYFEVRVGLDEAERAKLGDQALRPGLPAEVFIGTGLRTAASYIVKPLADQIIHAFR